MDLAKRELVKVLKELAAKYHSLACATFRRACNRVWAKGRTIILKVLFSSCALSLCSSLVEVLVEVGCYLLVLYKSQPGFHENLNENLKSHGFV